jgi:chromosome segregation ATPase
MSSRSSLIAKIGGLETEENVDVLKEIVSEVDELFDSLELFENEIDDLKDELKDKKSEINELESEVEELQDKDVLEFDNQTHNNLRTQSVLEDLLKNIDYIPIAELEEFVAKHRKL